MDVATRLKLEENQRSTALKIGQLQELEKAEISKFRQESLTREKEFVLEINEQHQTKKLMLEQIRQDSIEEIQAAEKRASFRVAESNRKIEVVKSQVAEELEESTRAHETRRESLRSQHEEEMERIKQETDKILAEIEAGKGSCRFFKLKFKKFNSK